MPDNDRIDQIYKILIDYIQRDDSDKTAIRKDLNDIKVTVDRVERQTIKTNGRVTKLEGEMVTLQTSNNKQLVVRKVNWKWLTAIGTVMLAVFSLISDFLVEWLKYQFFK